MDSTVNNVLFALGDTGRDEDDACSGSSETAGFLDFKERGILSMADHWQQTAVQQLTVAVAVANNDIAVSQ